MMIMQMMIASPYIKCQLTKLSNQIYPQSKSFTWNSCKILRSQEFKVLKLTRLHHKQLFRSNTIKGMPSSVKYDLVRRI